MRDWLNKALSDFIASKKLVDDEKTLDCSVFHTHQCAEKALKAFIILTKKPIPKTHDLKFLLELCAGLDSAFVLHREDVKTLNTYGFESRYPNDFFYVDQQEAKQAVAMAEKIFFTVQKKIQ